MNKDTYYIEVENRFPNHKHIFSNIVGEKILIYDFELEDIEFIEFLNKIYPLVIVITNSFEKYTYAKNSVRDSEHYILQEVTNTDFLVDGEFHTVIMFNTLSNIRNNVMQKVPLKNLQTIAGSVRHIEMNSSLLIKEFLENVNKKIEKHGTVIINDFNFIDSNDYSSLTTIDLNDKELFLLDKFLNLRLNRTIDLQFIPLSDSLTTVAGNYKDIYSFLTTRVRLGHELKPIFDLIDENGVVNDVPNDSLMLCGSISYLAWSYYFQNVIKVKNVRVFSKSSKDIGFYVNKLNFLNLHDSNNVIDNDRMSIIYKI